MKSSTRKPHICLVDYYLDGYYHHWEEIHRENFPEVGSRRKLCCRDQQEKEGVVTDIKTVSEMEYHVFLATTND